MKIEVTARDIEKGLPEDKCGCPVALAIRRATGLEVSVWCSMSVKVGREYIDLPDEAEDFINRFDQGEPVQPFTFDL